MQASVMIVVLLLLQAPLASPPRSLDDILASVSKNVKEFQDLLPDFVCNEKITSTAYESGKVKQIKTVDSIFTAVQKPGPAPRGQTAFSETRDVMAIDGRPVREGTGMPRLPLGMFGGFGALLSMTFSPKNLERHDYKLDGAVADSQLAIHFVTKEGQSGIRSLLNGEAFINKDEGMAWIDSSSMQVVRLQRDFFSLPRSLKQMRHTVEYGPTTIGEREFWLPHTMRTDATDRDPKKTKTFLAEYMNCKKFTTDIKIVP